MLRVMTIAGAALLATVFTAQAEGDAAKGERVFKKCMACHAVGEGAKNKVGPQLNGVVGAAWGRIEGYKYSKALLQMAEADGKIWDDEALDAYLTKPKALIKKGKMAFAGLRKEQDRADVIAYLAQFKEDGTTE